MTVHKAHFHPSDLRGLGRLTADAISGVTDLVEALHHNIARGSGIFGKSARGPTKGITGLVYRSIRGVSRGIGGGLDAVLGKLAPLLGERQPTPEREAVVAALNGVLGDYLAQTRSPLAIAMRFRKDGEPLEISKPALAAAFPNPAGKLLVRVHGLCMNDVQLNHRLSGLGSDLGYAAIDLHYNSGRHISTNGREFAALMESLVACWPAPVEAVAIVAHSMGGLLARSACHYGALAGHDWPRRVRKLVFVTTPHHGAPLERGGHWVDVILGGSPYSAPFARLAKLRSAGITDLRHGNLLDEDWEGRDRFQRTRHRPRFVPLPEGVACYAIAASIAKQPGRPGGRLLGDGLVPVKSALGRHRDLALSLAIPESRTWIGYGTNHLELLRQSAFQEQLGRWLAQP